MKAGPEGRADRIARVCGRLGKGRECHAAYRGLGRGAGRRRAELNFGLRGGLLGSSVSLGNARKAGPQQSGLECWGMHLGSG